MKYLIAFVPDGGKFSLFSPDFPEFDSCGDDFHDAMHMASDCLRTPTHKSGDAQAGLIHLPVFVALFLQFGKRLVKVIIAPDGRGLCNPFRFQHGGNSFPVGLVPFRIREDAVLTTLLSTRRASALVARG